MPSSRQARMTRTAISPRLAIRILVSTAANVRGVSTLDAIWLRETTSTGGRTWPTGWAVTVVAETGSTNADLLAAATGRGTRPDRAGRRPPDRRPRTARPTLGGAVREQPARLGAAPPRSRARPRGHAADRHRSRRGGRGAQRRGAGAQVAERPACSTVASSPACWPRPVSAMDGSITSWWASGSTSAGLPTGRRGRSRS